MERVKVGVLLLALAAPLAQGTWAQIGASPVKSLLVQALKWATYTAVIFLITYAAFKLLHGRARACSGAPARGYREKFVPDARTVWFAVALVLLPFIIYILAKVGLLPPWLPSWVAQEMSDIIGEIWGWSPGK
jgi:hypothetical protein